MSIEETFKKEMLSHIKSSIDYLEKAMNVVESNDNYNDGQSKELNKIYDKVEKAVGILESV